MAVERGININSIAPEQKYEYAEDRGAIYQGIFGQSGILNIAEKLDCTKYSNNEVRMASGDYINQGYQIRIPFGETRAFEIENGTIGQKRHDLIIAEFERVSQLKDAHSFKVIKGTSNSTNPQDPALTQQDLNAGGTLRQEALYRIVLDGIEITGIERVADYIDMQNADKLGGNLPDYYATKAEVDSKAPAVSPVFTGPVTANGGVRLPDNQQVAWSTGWGIYAIGANALYIKAPTGHNKYLHFGISDGAWSLLPNTPVQLGTANYKWEQIYSTNATISTSDLKDKKDIILMTEEQARPFIMALKPCLYKLIDGTSGRTHYGLIAQEVEEAMRECGISDMEFAGFIKSPKIEREQVGTTKDGAPVYRDKVIEGEYVYGLRYEEFIAPIISVAQSLMEENAEIKLENIRLNELIESLAERVETLEQSKK